MKLTKIALAVLLGAASMAASAADNSTSQSPADSGTLSSADGAAKKDPSQSLQILQPKAGAIITGKTTVTAVVRVGDGIQLTSLRVTLNGTSVSSQPQKEECKENACRWTVELTKADRLLAGQNQLVAFARGSDNSIKMSQTNFDYYAGLQAGQNLPQWLPPAVGLSLNSGGAQPWVTLTTGWPANMQDSLDPTQYQIPYRDITFPTVNDTPCTSRYQVVVLNRENPAQEDGYMCAPDSATLKSDLANLTKGAEIVLVGTMQYQNADAGLDTTSIGGTNYTSPNTWQPMGYAAIGVSGAAPGSAYESYYVASDVGKAYQRNPFANGLLVADGYGNYNFHAGNNVQFQVYPNNPNTGSSNVFIAENNTVFGWYPPYGSANGFWLLVLDRVTLLPIDYNSQGPCYPGISICGQFFSTGSTDASVASKAVDDLAFALEAPTSRQLVILTTMGQPFQSASAAGPLVGHPVMRWYGTPPYTLQSLTTSTSTYTLVAPGPQTSPYFSTDIPAKSPFSQGVVNSSSAFSQQGQTGFVRGVMARDNNSLYYPSVVSQEDPSLDASGKPKSVSVDYDFYSISSQMPIDWPLTDTAGHMAAYHWASQTFIDNHFGKPADGKIDPLSADVRYWYTSPSRNTKMAEFNTDFQCTSNPPSTSPCAYPGDGLGFTATDLADVDAELYNELTALNDTDGYLGSSGIGNVIQNSFGTSGSLSDQVINATYEVLDGQVGAVPNTSVSASMYDWLNLFAGVTSTAAASFSGDCACGQLMGVTSGMLWTASAWSPWATNDPGTPPSYENTFDTTLGDLQSKASAYAENMVSSYDDTLNAIYGDWGKLSATGAKTSDSSSGWYFPNEDSAAALGVKLQDGVRRSLYLQLLPKFYWADTFSEQPVSDVSLLGMFYSHTTSGGQYFENSCTATYSPAVSSLGSAHYESPSDAGKYDFYVMDGVINNQGTTNVSESLPSDTLLNTLFEAPPDDSQDASTESLNIPYELVYGAFLLPSRPGPSQGTYWGVSQCYKPGCTDLTSAGHTSSCIAP